MSARLRVQLTIVLFVLAIAVGSNWPFQYTRLHKEKQTNTSRIPWPTKVSSAFRLAGWPTKYYLSVDKEVRGAVPGGVVFADEENRTLEVVSWTRLATNLLFWGTLLGAVLLYERWSHSRSSDGKHRLSIAELLALMLFVALGIVYGRNIRAESLTQQAFAERVIAQGGAIEFSALAPEIIQPYLPASCYSWFNRIENAYLKEPDTELVKEVLQMPLACLAIDGGKYDLRALDDLPTLPMLASLRIAERDIDNQLLAKIGATKQLTDIDLTGTNVTEDALAVWGEMPQLYVLSLQESSFYAEAPEAPSWAAKVQEIELPRPNSESARHQLKGWPELLIVRCKSNALRNSSSVELSLSDMPELLNVYLDPLQRFDLSLENLPKLNTVSNDFLKVKERIAQGQFVPASPWLSSLRANKLSILPRLQVHAEDLQQVQIAAAPLLNFMLVNTSWRSTAGGTARVIDGTSETADKEDSQRWVDVVARCNGLQSVSLANLPLENADLSSLSGATGLDSLELEQTGLRDAHLLAMSGIKGVRRINLLGNLISGNAIEAFLSKNPEVRELECDPLTVTRLRLRGNDKIEKVFGPAQAGVSRLEALWLEGVNALRDTVEFAPHAVFCKVVKAPALEGIVFRAPVPKQLVIEGLRDLKYFAAGGPQLNEAASDAVLACQGLERLTLAHTTLAPKCGEAIGQLNSLTYLCLTGTTISDDQIRNWNVNPRLTTLRLDGTGIRAATAMRLADPAQVTELRLDGWDASTLSQLVQFESLQALGIGDADVDLTVIESLKKMRSLRRVYFSRCNLAPGVLPALAEACSNLKELGLRDSTVNARGIYHIAKTNPVLRFDIEGAETDPSALDFLVGAGRVFGDEMDFRSFGWRQFEKLTEEEMEAKKGIVDPARFASGADAGLSYGVYGGPVPASTGFSQVETYPAGDPAFAVERRQQEQEARHLRRWDIGLAKLYLTRSANS